MGAISEEGEPVPSECNCPASEEQKTIRVLIVCAAVVIGWCAWNIRGCDAERTEQMRLERQLETGGQP